MSTHSEIENSTIGQKLIAAGYAITNTGGGIDCWARTISDGITIIVGHMDEPGGEYDIGESGDESNWGSVGIDGNGNSITDFAHTGTLDEIIGITEAAGNAVSTAAQIAFLHNIAGMLLPTDGDSDIDAVEELARIVSEARRLTGGSP